jgi:hypothetical protein
MNEEQAKYQAEIESAKTGVIALPLQGPLDKLAIALAKAQGAMQSARKDATNPFFGSKYSTLAEVWDSIREPLANNGLSIVQLPSVDGGMVHVTTVLLHISGQTISSKISFLLHNEWTKAGKEIPPSAQQVCGLVTFGRRYGLTAMVGVSSADDDDDGNAASHVADHAPVTAPAPKAQLDPARVAKRVGTMPPAEPVAPPPPPAPKDPVAQPAAEPVPDTQQEAFHGRLYDACEAAGITVEELDSDLHTKGILKGSMKIDNLGEKIVAALLDGKDAKSGKGNWEIVVARIKAARK